MPALTWEQVWHNWTGEYTGFTLRDPQSAEDLGYWIGAANRNSDHPAVQGGYSNRNSWYRKVYKYLLNQEFQPLLAEALKKGYKQGNKTKL
jgi:hypothetical protein